MRSLCASRARRSDQAVQHYGSEPMGYSKFEAKYERRKSLRPAKVLMQWHRTTTMNPVLHLF